MKIFIFLSLKNVTDIKIKQKIIWIEYGFRDPEVDGQQLLKEPERWGPSFFNNLKYDYLGFIHLAYQDPLKSC